MTVKIRLRQTNTTEWLASELTLEPLGLPASQIATYAAELHSSITGNETHSLFIELSEGKTIFLYRVDPLVEINTGWAAKDMSYSTFNKSYWHIHKYEQPWDKDKEFTLEDERLMVHYIDGAPQVLTYGEIKGIVDNDNYDVLTHTRELAHVSEVFKTWMREMEDKHGS